VPHCMQEVIEVTSCPNISEAARWLRYPESLPARHRRVAMAGVALRALSKCNGGFASLRIYMSCRSHRLSARSSRLAQWIRRDGASVLTSHASGPCAWVRPRNDFRHIRAIETRGSDSPQLRDSR
jgi:hypothetical protein